MNFARFVSSAGSMFGNLFSCTFVLLVAVQPIANAAAPAASASVPAESPTVAVAPVMLTLYNRDITELRSPLSGTMPPERVQLAQKRFSQIGEAQLKASVTTHPTQWNGVKGNSILIGQEVIFNLLETDLDSEAQANYSDELEKARLAVEQALAARIEQTKPLVWLFGMLQSLAAVLVCSVGAWWIYQLHEKLAVITRAVMIKNSVGFMAYARILGLRVMTTAVWALMALLFFAGALVLLHAFPWTQPWSQRVWSFVRDLGGGFALAALGAIPGLLTVALILLLAKAVQEVVSLFLSHVQSGRLSVPFMHRETTQATRRILTMFIWGMAVVIAYPYLPGSSSMAFQGLSVMLGLMATLGSAGLVSQLMSGLVVVYSRSLAKDDFVAIGNVEGVVLEAGVLAVKIVTVRDQVITIPNSMVTTSSVRNYSKMSAQQGTVISTTVGVGYDTPWRKVHEMLKSAALQTEGIRAEPQPIVYQRALKDWHAEYELFVQIDQPRSRVAILSALHAAIQDEFSKAGAVIMGANALKVELSQDQKNDQSKAAAT